MKVNLKVCRKEQGIAEPGNTCLTTPGTCESCPNWAMQPTKRRAVNKSKSVQRSMKHLRDNGWQVAIVEKYLKPPGAQFGRRIDCFGFGDLLACRPMIDDPKRTTLLKPTIALVQCCRDADMAEHRAKILGQPMEHWTQEERDESKEIFEKFKVWKASGGRVFLQGWGFRGRRGEKQWTLREEVL